MGATAETIGALAVLFTILYLATQIRQTNSISRYSASSNIMNQFNELNLLVATNSVLRATLEKDSELTKDEKDQVYRFAISYCNVWVSIQAAYDNGMVDRTFFETGARDVQIELNRWPSFRPAVEEWLQNYPDFTDLEIFAPLKVFV